MKEAKTTDSSLRETLKELAGRLVRELREAQLTPSRKLSFLKTILPYAFDEQPTPGDEEGKEPEP